MRARWMLATVVLLALGGAAIAARRTGRAIEERAADMIRRQGTPLGLTVEAVRFSWMGPLRLDRLRVAAASGERLLIDEAGIGWGLAGGGEPRAHVRRVSLRGVKLERGALVVEWPAAELDVLGWGGDAGGEHIRLRQGGSGGELEARLVTSGLTRHLAVSLGALDLSAARVTWQSEPVVAPGSWSGRFTVADAPGHLGTEGTLTATGVRVSLPRGLGLGNGEYGAPTAVALDWSGVRDGESVDVRRMSARVGGLELEAHGRMAGTGDDRTVALDVFARSDLGTALQTAALRLPGTVPVGPADDLGTASFDVAVHGPVARPADLRIVPHLRYEATPQVAEKLEFLRRPFRYTPAEGSGVTLDLREGAAGFVPLVQVPPLFLRALLVSEDAGFYSHPGIDVAEIQTAWATNVERGTAARGASTITQQLVKNLFLSKDKSYGRKLEEAALALLVDAAVPKARILEIYLNVIEWGPNLFGLGPAARHYFGKAPAELTPKEMVFLVCLIPSPVRYHQAHATGRVGPGMDQLMANLLAKLRSVDAIAEDEYVQALAEELRFQPEGGFVETPASGL
jgi:hypothetical protein